MYVGYNAHEQIIGDKDMELLKSHLKYVCTLVHPAFLYLAIAYVADRPWMPLFSSSHIRSLRKSLFPASSQNLRRDLFGFSAFHSSPP